MFDDDRYDCTLVRLQNGKYEPWGLLRTHDMTVEEIAAMWGKDVPICEISERNTFYWMGPQGMVSFTDDDPTRWDIKVPSIKVVDITIPDLKPRRPYYRELEGNKW